MAITYETKVVPKTKSKATAKGKQAAINEAATKMLELDELIGPHKAEVEILSKAYGDAKTELENLLNLADDEGTEVVVDRGMVKVGPKAEKTTITKPEKCAELLDDVKPGLFMELAKVTLGNLKKYLSGVEYAAITETTRDGGRKATLKHAE